MHDNKDYLTSGLLLEELNVKEFDKNKVGFQFFDQRIFTLWIRFQGQTLKRSLPLMKLPLIKHLS